MKPAPTTPKKPRKRKQIPDLIPVEPTQTGGGSNLETAIRIGIFRRKASRFWQALIVWNGYRKRVTTRTTLKASALQYAELAYRHYSAESRKPDFIKHFTPKHLQ